MKLINKNKKIRIGIDINEVLRCRWLVFDKYYVQEFGEDGVPQNVNPYSYDLFNSYKFSDIEKDEKFLKDEIPEDINPKYYQVNPETNEADVDSLIFKTEKIKMTARQVFNKFMYEDYLLEIHGLAPLMYKGMETDIQKFYLKYNKFVDFVIVSKENDYTIPPTLFFLSKLMFRAKKYSFVQRNKDMWKDIDILITTDPELLNNKPFNKKVIKVNRPYNQSIKSNFEIIQLNDLTDNEKFEKLVKYKA